MKFSLTKKGILRLSLFTLTLLLVTELFLRFNYGFCDAPLYQYDEQYEYIAQPNQQGERFGNDYYFNSHSQRSDEPEKSGKIILGLGDSVLNGGTLTDQDSLATSIFSNNFSKIQMLNISAGSWGPDNVAAYLNKHGSFNAEQFFLVVSSHDAYDIMDFKEVVGLHPSYPEKQYSLALIELVDRYVLPRIKKKLSSKNTLDPDEKVLEGIQKNGESFNPGFEEIRLFAEKNNVKIMLYLHAEKSELKIGEYNLQGKEILNWANTYNIPVIQGIDYGFSDEHYQDKIHLNEQGQAKLAEVMLQEISI